MYLIKFLKRKERRDVENRKCFGQWRVGGGVFFSGGFEERDPGITVGKD